MSENFDFELVHINKKFKKKLSNFSLFQKFKHKQFFEIFKHIKKLKKYI